jgi:hypothetical protein
MPKEPVFWLEDTFPGGILINLEDIYAAGIAARLVAVLSLFFRTRYTSHKQTRRPSEVPSCLHQTKGRAPCAMPIIARMKDHGRGQND